MDKCIVSWKRICSLCVSFLLLMGAGALGILWTQNAKHFPVRVIEITEALKQIPEDTLMDCVSPHLVKGFFWLKVQSIQHDIANVAWVVSSSVKRVWPDKIQVSLQERMPQARFGEKGVMDTEGHVFYPEYSANAVVLNKLPLFTGPVEKSQDMLQQYYTVLESLGPLGLTVTELHLSDYGALEIMLDNGIALILGRTALGERLNRFVLAYELELKAQMDQIVYIDCRYTNGLAIGYKTGYKVGSNTRA